MTIYAVRLVVMADAEVIGDETCRVDTERTTSPQLDLLAAVVAAGRSALDNAPQELETTT